MQGLAAGIPYADLGNTPVNAIVLGWEAVRLKIYTEAEVHIQAQLGKLSPVSLGKAAEEEESAEDKRYAVKGAEIKARIEESLRFSLMPEHLQAAWVRQQGRWPGNAVSKAKPIAGLDKELAKELIAFSESGVIGNDNDPLWKYVLSGRLHATAKG